MTGLEGLLSPPSYRVNNGCKNCDGFLQAADPAAETQELLGESHERGGVLVILVLSARLEVKDLACTRREARIHKRLEQIEAKTLSGWRS